MTAGEVIPAVVSALLLPFVTLNGARIGGHYRALRLPSVWGPIAVAVAGGAVSVVALLTRGDVTLGWALGPVAFFAGWTIAFIRLTTLNRRFLDLMARLTKYLDDSVRPEHPALVEKDFLELQRLVVKLQPAVPDGETMLRQIDEVLRVLRRQKSFAP